MSPRSVSWLAWSLWAMTIALVIGGLILGVANHPEAPLYEYWFESTLIDPTFATLGALIVSRRLGNVIGWIFCAAGFGGSIQFLFGLERHRAKTLGGLLARLAAKVAA